MNYLSFINLGLIVGLTYCFYKYEQRINEPINFINQNRQAKIRRDVINRIIDQIRQDKGVSVDNTRYITPFGDYNPVYKQSEKNPIFFT